MAVVAVAVAVVVAVVVVVVVVVVVAGRKPRCTTRPVRIVRVSVGPRPV